MAQLDVGCGNDQAAHHGSPESRVNRHQEGSNGHQRQHTRQPGSRHDPVRGQQRSRDHGGGCGQAGGDDCQRPQLSHRPGSESARRQAQRCSSQHPRSSQFPSHPSRTRPDDHQQRDGHEHGRRRSPLPVDPQDLLTDSSSGRHPPEGHGNCEQHRPAGNRGAGGAQAQGQADNANQTHEPGLHATETCSEAEPRHDEGEHHIGDAEPRHRDTEICEHRDRSRQCHIAGCTQ